MSKKSFLNFCSYGVVLVVIAGSGFGALAQTRDITEWMQIFKAAVERNPNVVSSFVRQNDADFTARCAAMASVGSLSFINDPQMARRNQQGAANTAAIIQVTGPALSYWESKGIPAKRMYETHMKIIQTNGAGDYLKGGKRCAETVASVLESKSSASK